MAQSDQQTLANFEENADWVASDGTKTARHLAVLIHGLWGTPSHLYTVAASLRSQHPVQHLHILIPRTNASTFTYDGIDVGGERVAEEIERYIAHLQEAGKAVSRISFIGYSLGGLIARYATGILHAKNFFDQVKPINFTTFATPHLGVAAPTKSFASRTWNWLGALTLSASGQQLFASDTFRDSDQPLLSLMADPDGIFMHGLLLFEHRALYANIVNDRSVPFFTGSISAVDPFTADMSRLKINYLAGYEPILLDSDTPFSIAEQDKQSFLEHFSTSTQRIISQLPFTAAMTLFFTIGTPLYLCNAVVQSIRSKRRIRFHEMNRIGTGLSYRTIFTIEDIDGKVMPAPGAMSKDATEGETVSHELTKDPAWELPLSTAQQKMIDDLQGVFKKHLVHIHKARHSHAAIIVRSRLAGNDRLSEGKMVIKHWLANEFELQ